jgi:hypothetical protein
MSNTKVYLAKHPLASGTDSEFVKSHLSRIPGIAIVECGMDIKPRECAALVIIPDSSYDPENDGIVTVTKSLYKIITGFLKDQRPDAIYIYTGRGESDGGDVESSTPMYVTLEDMEVEDDNNFDNYGIVYLSDIDFQGNLLEEVSRDISENPLAYINVPRHYQPAPQFAIPPIPSVDDRRMGKQYGTIAERESGDLRANYHLEEYKPSLGRRPLLKRRK